MNDYIVLIPAFNPDVALETLVLALTEAGCPVLVVDDGSGPGSAGTLARIADQRGVSLLRNGANLGKGAALKAGLKHIYRNMPQMAGVVTADADGQHREADILRVGEALLCNPNTMILGTRTLDLEAPLRSRFGNRLTRSLLRLLTGLKVADTQTGLRGLPMSLVPCYMDLSFNRYEYELFQLIKAKRLSHRIVQVPIASVYIDGNQGSHFRPVLDSLRIYYVLFRFTSSSLVCAALDYAVFMICYFMLGNLLVSQYTARIVSGTVNFNLNRSMVFRSGTGFLAGLCKYAILAVTLAFVSYLAIVRLSRAGVPVVLAKPIAESILFAVSFWVQRYVILRPR